jgi:hypothetical protein
VQQALRILHRRGLVHSKQHHMTDTPAHSVQRPWADRAARRVSASAGTRG